MWIRASFDRMLLTLLILALAGTVTMFASGGETAGVSNLAQGKRVQGTTEPKPGEFRPSAASSREPIRGSDTTAGAERRKGGDG